MTVNSKMRLIKDLSMYAVENGLDLEHAQSMMDVYAELVVDLTGMMVSYDNENTRLTELVLQYKKENKDLKKQLKNR